ncbi:hypothetical protein GOBAR_AA18587 [Gossypium barbadense]|uniref:RNase H type-1 domain-containing protein n=1 Tax=Gossypium barbadense TaxID=3634 RepID=A0A2P5XFH1_GOSBA|nr:hypothetical protein GOBAR_AA18587 [Gossypium barbadense]
MKSGSQIAEFVLNYLNELEGLNMYVHERRIPTVRWATPIGSRVKINFDATFNRHKRELCSGPVVRNEKAEVIFSSTILNVNIPDSNRVAHAIATKGIKMGVSTYLSNRVPPGAEAMAAEE